VGGILQITGENGQTTKKMTHNTFVLCLGVIIVILSLIAGYNNTGWITDDFSPTISLLGLFWGLWVVSKCLND